MITDIATAWKRADSLNAKKYKKAKFKVYPWKVGRGFVMVGASSDEVERQRQKTERNTVDAADDR